MVGRGTGTYVLYVQILTNHERDTFTWGVEWERREGRDSRERRRGEKRGKRREGIDGREKKKRTEEREKKRRNRW